jgi:hypothetical protein
VTDAFFEDNIQAILVDIFDRFLERHWRTDSQGKLNLHLDIFAAPRNPAPRKTWQKF